MYATESNEVDYVAFIEDTQPKYLSEFSGEQDDPYAGKWGGPHNKGLENI